MFYSSVLAVHQHLRRTDEPFAVLTLAGLVCLYFLRRDKLLQPAYTAYDVRCKLLAERLMLECK